MVRVDWYDAVCLGSAGWNDPSDLDDWTNEEPPLMYSVGFLVYESKDWVVLVDSLGPHEVGCANKIPCRWIKGIHRLKAQTERITPDGKDSSNW